MPLDMVLWYFATWGAVVLILIIASSIQEDAAKREINKKLDELINQSRSAKTKKRACNNGTGNAGTNAWVSIAKTKTKERKA
jgi:hypothetical protein